MSLKGFHIVFITASLALALGMGVWCLRIWQVNGEGLWLAATAGSFAAAGALIVYGVWFLRKLRRWEQDAARDKTSSMRDPPGGDGGGPRAARHTGV